MSWVILFHDDFDAEIQGPPQALHTERIKGDSTKRLIAIADARIDQHLAALKETEKEHKHGKKS